MNILRVSSGIRQIPPHFRSFSGSPIVNVGLKTLSLATKAPITLCGIVGIGFAYNKYQEVKKDIQDKLDPVSKFLEKVGVKKPPTKKESLEDKVRTFFRSILAANPIDDSAPFTTLLPAIDSLHKIAAPHIIDWIEEEQKKITPPKNEPITPTLKAKTISGAFFEFIKVSHARILYDLETKNTELKNELEKRKK